MESKQPSFWSDKSHQPVEPVSPVAPWIGGKRNLAALITSRIHDTPHGVYAEPFVGMGGIFFRRSLRPSSEVINDKGRDVATLFRVLRDHYVPFVEMIRYQITSRAEFERLKAEDPDTLTDLKRAARFLYLQRTAFGGKVTGQNFGVAVGEPPAFDPLNVTPILDAVHARLHGVVIECLDFADFITRYDREETLFYIDPPYDGSEHYYGKGLFTPADHGKLATVLANIRGRFMLSINDTPDMRTTFASFHIEEVETTYTVQDNGAQPAKELLITPAR
jgi:DNA adenine methylase